MKNCDQEVANKENVPNADAYAYADADADADADTKSLTPSGQKQYVSPWGRHNKLF